MKKMECESADEEDEDDNAWRTNLFEAPQTTYKFEPHQAPFGEKLSGFGDLVRMLAARKVYP